MQSLLRAFPRGRQIRAALCCAKCPSGSPDPPYRLILSGLPLALLVPQLTLIMMEQPPL
jgi:hypothetical protein